MRSLWPSSNTNDHELILECDGERLLDLQDNEMDAFLRCIDDGYAQVSENGHDAVIKIIDKRRNE